ncbi:MAG: cytochrome C [Bryobacteraceae bacterium]
MTRLLRFTGATAVALGVLTAGLLLNTQASRADSDHDDNGDESRIQQGFKIAPVPLNLKGKNRSRVGLGSYLVNAVGGCNDCHTWRKTGPNAPSNYENLGDPFLGQPEQIYRAGYLAGGRDFGPFRSRNLTPDSTGKVADGYSTFKEIMRHGFDPDHLTPVLQVMPWPVHRNMTDNDLQAIYEFLTSIPCVEGNPGESFQTPDGGVTHRCH